MKREQEVRTIVSETHRTPQAPIRGPWLPLAGLLACLGTAAPQARAQDDLTAEANQIACQQLEQFGKGYTARVDPSRHIVYVSALDEAQLQQTVNLLVAFADAYRRTLPTCRVGWNVVVCLPTVDDYHKLKLPFEGCTGFYTPAGHRVVAIDRGRTLLHEFTHALHHADAANDRQVHPIWVTEGLATLFEASEITPSGLRPEVDLRLPTVQRALRAHKAIPLQRLVTMGREPFLKDAELAYAQARYLMFYLHHRGRLDDWYKQYKATFVDDPDGVKALEFALGNRLSVVEPDWIKWVQSLDMPASENRSQQARLGLQVQADPRGVVVVGMLPGSPAQTAGRIRTGDVIRKLNDRPVTNLAEMAGALRAAGANQTIRIDLLRNGQPTTVIQPLGAAGT
jgi:hypothetical protein